MVDGVEIGIGLATAIIIVIGNFKTVKYVVWKTIEPLNKKVDQLNETQDRFEIILSSHSETLNRYTSNEAFFKSIEETIDEAVRYLKDEEDACKYINVVGHYVIAFSKDILLAGINKIPDRTVNTKANCYLDKAKEMNLELFGKEFSTTYKKKYLHITKKYIKDVCGISDDNVNDKTKRFRSITMVYIETVASNFVNFFLENKNLIG